MPGADSRYKPPTASDFSVSDEASQLELHLQRQLEEDIARIFDESIYSDLEVVCGKLKILTHSCILKARTKKFYHKLKTILHVNITRSTFDEIYSFVSDTYTECNITNQEKEILNYLKTVCFNSSKKKKESDEHEEFLTPKSASPFKEKVLKKSISSSPSTELTKEYYALVPIESHLLEKELIEQDVLSSGFQSIISLQSSEIDKINNLQLIKPTSLALVSSHTSKTVKHSNSCDILNQNHLKDDIISEIDKDARSQSSTIASQKIKANQSAETNKFSDFKNLKSCESVLDKTLETAYSPDSLITDDPSSASDYLSAAFAYSPGISYNGPAKLNVEDNITKMENNFTSSDSGLENTGLLESLSSHRDVTLTDMSLTESTLHDFTTDDGSNSHDSSLSPVAEMKHTGATILENYSDTAAVVIMSSETNSQNNEEPFQHKEMSSCSSSKEEKQRHNEEIVVLESSSLSSETGSWESVFPPKLPLKDACEKFIRNERERFNEFSRMNIENTSVQKSPFKSASCFIDAASLVDDEDEAIQEICVRNDIIENAQSELPPPAASQPVPCSTNKSDLSPNDWSENDNEDSLEQQDNKDPDSIQKDLSPTIFEMTPITEDSLCTNTFEPGEKEENIKALAPTETTTLSRTVFESNTPHNSILSLKTTAIKQYESEESESDTTVVGHEEQVAIKNLKNHHEASPIISGGASVEDHLPTVGSYKGSPMTRKRMENAPILSGAYIPPPESEISTKSPRLPSAPAWVVDMSSTPKPEAENSGTNRSTTKKPGDKTCESLRNYSKQSSSSDNCSKSRNSVDSDSSDKSSHKFFIDMSNIAVPEKFKTQNESDSLNEKKNMFSMYIDFNDKNTLKEMPARLSSLSTKKNNTTEPNNVSSNNASSSNAADNTMPHSTNNFIFEKFESLCKDPNISIAEILQSHESYIKEQEKKSCNKSIYYMGEKQYLQSFHESADMQDDEEQNNYADELYVKLSDLDKPFAKSDSVAKNGGAAKNVGIANNDGVQKNKDNPIDERMTRSIPENNWSNQNQTGTSRSNEVINSFHSENAQSLNRLFPHLRNEFSRSMPGSLASRTRSPIILGYSPSPGDMDYDDQASDASELSSIDFGRDSTEETSQPSSLLGNCQSRLGQDLLRMFLEEIAPDVIVEVSGRRIKAHKCILSSRCQYFAGILSGGWVESAGNVIALPPFSFNVVHFALCHIYSGVSTIPDTISIVELATLADMLGLEGLKEAIMFTLKAKYCHHFHSPCPVCRAGVLECLPLSSLYGLDDLYRKCLKWIAKFFSNVWASKGFANLPSELIEKCYQQVIMGFKLEIIVDFSFGCGILTERIRPFRWAEGIIRLAHRLNQAVARYIAPRLAAALRDMAQLPPDPPLCGMAALEQCMRAAIEWAPPDECCRAYALLTDVVTDIRENRLARPDLIKADGYLTTEYDNLLYEYAANWLQLCEAALVRAAPRVCCTQAFIDLPSELRRRLRELGCIIYQAAPPQPRLNRSPAAPNRSPAAPNRRSRSTQSNTKPKKSHGSATSKSLDIDHMRACFVPYAPKPTTQAKADTQKSSANLQDNKKSSQTVPPRVRTTKAQEERAKFNLTKNTLSQERLNAKTQLKTSYESAKPRYLEPKVSSNSKKQSVAKKLGPKMISSSESSRNSSPIQARHLRVSRMTTRAAGMPSGSLLPASQPPPSQLLASQPLPSQLPASQPPPSQLPASQPPPSQLPASQPSPSRPPPCQLPASQPSPSQLPLSQPPRSQLPASQPSASQPPASRPHTAEPSTDSLSESQTSKYATYTKTKHTTKGSIDTNKSGKAATTANSASTTNVKARTKIPVYLNQVAKPIQSEYIPLNKSQSEARKKSSNSAKTSGTTTSNTSVSLQPRHKAPEKSASCSLMNATKSSSAKMVTKVVRDAARATVPAKSAKKRTQRRGDDPPSEERPVYVSIPAMERSGTFLKDEPTFGIEDIELD